MPPVAKGSARFGELEAVSPCMREVFALLNRLAPTDIAVTLTGETGTGKGIVAHGIHRASARAGGPFVVFDCGAIAPDLLEIELFGHEPGPSSDRANGYPGVFERARGGTLFLDEVSELAPDLQPRVVRALETRSVRRAGGTEERRIDVRIVAATNRNLEQRVREERFREDLYFRLAGAIVAVPPLRERTEDLPLLVSRLLANLGRADVRLDPPAYEKLKSQSWPGNVRQLENALACALACVDGGVLGANELRFSQAEAGDSPMDRLPLAGQALEVIERAAIKQTLALTGGMKVRTAELLGIAVSTLYQKLKKYGL